jgi:murein DD-endopeptidase MepM/ murein hydrolase activator NlpD
VKRGQEIERGQVIAALGSSGRSTGPHLHYVVEVSGKAVNPLNYIFD